MSHTSSPLPSLALTALLTAVVACGTEGSHDRPDGGAEPTQTPVALTAGASCVNGDLGQRSRMYNDSTLDVAQKGFGAHFKAWANNSEHTITNTTIALDLDKFITLRNSLQPKPVAIQVNYGLDGIKLYPVLEFLKLSSNGGDVESMNTYYVVDGDSLRKASDTPHDPKVLMADYRKNIRVLRTDAHTTWDSVRTVNTDFPDPLAEWFQFDLELSKLIADNPSNEKRSIVLTAISEPVCYSGTHGFINATDNEEFRHMIAWYITANGVPMLDGTSLSRNRPQGDIYLKRAVDLGHLCPPRCKKVL